MAPRYTIRSARPGDCSALPAIERAASELFRGLVPESLFDDVYGQMPWHIQEQRAELLSTPEAPVQEGGGH